MCCFLDFGCGRIVNFAYGPSTRRRALKLAGGGGLKLDQKPITRISGPGHTSTRFDWLELVLAYDSIG